MPFSAPRPDGGLGPHPHRSWLHLLPQDPDQRPVPDADSRARQILVEEGLAVLGPEGSLLPGAEFASALGARPGGLPMAGMPLRGEVRVESGVLRFYPDPGPEGFDSMPLRSYRAPCPNCGSELDLFSLRFPHPDPHTASCPACGAAVSLLAVEFTPELPRAWMEITFGDLDHRPTLRPHPVFSRLERALGFRLREVHVSL